MPTELQLLRSVRTVHAILSALIVVGAVACDNATEPGTPSTATIHLEPTSLSLTVSESARLSARVENEAGEPVQADGIYWTSESESIATVAADGTVTGVGEGSVRIAASYAGRSALATVQVSAPPARVTSVVITPNAAALHQGDTQQFHAAVLDANGAEMDGYAVEWSSSDSRILEISDGGLATARAVGAVTVSAMTEEGVEGSAAVGVGPPPVATVAVSPAAVELEVGANAVLEASITAADGSALNGRPVTWSTSDAEIATVNANGRVTARAEGSATIEAISEEVRGTAAITVVRRPIATLEMRPEFLALAVGEEGQFEAIPRATDGTALSGREIAWESSDPGVVRIDDDGSVRAVSPGEASITATSEGRSASAGITVQRVPVTTVEVTPANVSIRAGESRNLTVRVRDADGAVLDGREVTWRSSNVAVATVNTEGRITAVIPGEVYVSASSEGRSDSARVTVTAGPPASLEVTPTAVSVLPGATAQLETTFRDAVGTIVSGPAVTWTSSQPSVASVNANGLVTAVSEGDAEITARAGTMQARVQVEVQTRPVDRVEVSPASATLHSGESITLEARPLAQDGSLLGGRAIAWSSEAPAVATVDSDGRVTAVSPGNARITATSAGRTGAAQIVVERPAVAEVAIDPATASLHIDERLILRATLRAADGAELTGREVTWTSDDAAVATVTAGGEVVAVGHGAAVITATSEGRSATSTISVVPRPIASIEISPAVATLNVDATRQLEARLTAADGSVLTGRLVEWSTSDPAVATVNADGLVTGEGAGQATITATSEGQSATATITVESRSVLTVLITPILDFMRVGQSQQFSATGYAWNGSPVPGRPVTWSSSAPQVLEISPTGLATARRPGAVVLFATIDGRIGSAAIVILGFGVSPGDGAGDNGGGDNGGGDDDDDDNDDDDEDDDDEDDDDDD